MVQTQLRAVAHDPTVPRYRPKVMVAEAQMSQGMMQTKANWEMQYAYGQSIRVDVTVCGWRQPDWRLWMLNEVIPVSIPAFGIDCDLLILGVRFKLSADAGKVTVLTVGPQEGATPSPKLLRRRRKGRRRSGGYDWSGLDQGDADNAPPDTSGTAA